MDDKTKRLLAAVRDAIQYMNPIAEIDIKGQLIEALGAFEEESIREELHRSKLMLASAYSNKKVGEVLCDTRNSLKIAVDFWLEQHS